MANEFENWLGSLPRKAGDYLISTPRRFAHEEDDYDKQYHNDPLIFDVGQGCMRLYRDYGGDISGPALEIGCGTGLMSLGLARESEFPCLLLTDPSPKFLDITRKKLARAGITSDKIAYGVLMGEELSHLPENTFSLILLRSVLHHIIDVGAFIADAAKALKPGGVIIMEEPCMEGAVVMASLAQSFPLIMQNAKQPLSAVHAKRVQLFLDTMKFYCRRDVDKSTAEDKHLFRVDELMKMGERGGLRMDFFANKTFYDWTPNAYGQNIGHSFTKFFRDYLQYAMAFDEDFMRIFDKHFAPHCKWVDELAVANNGPYMHGVFVYKKL